jgi:hypothetical protein
VDLGACSLEARAGAMKSDKGDFNGDFATGAMAFFLALVVVGTLFLLTMFLPHYR